jgi:putative transposase
MTTTDPHLLTVLKYIERNPVRAKMVDRPEDWKWGSAYRRVKGNTQQKLLLSELPVELPKNYRSWISEPEFSEELDEVRHSVEKGLTFGMSN